MEPVSEVTYEAWEKIDYNYLAQFHPSQPKGRDLLILPWYIGSEQCLKMFFLELTTYFTNRRWITWWGQLLNHGSWIWAVNEAGGGGEVIRRVLLHALHNFTCMETCCWSSPWLDINPIKADVRWNCLFILTDWDKGTIKTPLNNATATTSTYQHSQAI